MRGMKNDGCLGELSRSDINEFRSGYDTVHEKVIAYNSTILHLKMLF